MTLPDDTYTATVDRIEDEIAALLIEDDSGEDEEGHNREVVDEVHCHASELPESVREQLGVVTVTLTDGEITDIEHQPTETRQRKAELQNQFDQLAERPPDSDDEN